MSDTPETPRRAPRALTVLAGIAIVFLLLAGLYVGYQTMHILFPPNTYETAMLATVSDTVDAEGVLLFNESYVAGGGTLGYLAADGERVSAGTAVAEVYSDASQAALRQQLTQLGDQIDLLQKSQNASATQLDTMPCNYYYVHFMHGEMELVDAKEEEVARQQFERRRKAMAKEPCEPYGSYDESEIWLPKYWHIKKVTDQIHIDELIKQAIAEDYSTFENHKILCACRIQEALIEIARCFATAERERTAGGFPESYYKVQKIQEWLNASYAADISGERLEEEFDGNFDYMNRIFKRVTGQTIFQYLTAVRMEHAKRLIAQTTMHTGVIGQEVGYPDEYYFSKVFKRNVGMSPRAYADSLSKNKS